MRPGRHIVSGSHAPAADRRRAATDAAATPAADGSSFVASLAKGLAVIRCFGADARRLTLSDVAERTGFSRATARRFLLTLTRLGYAIHDGRYFELTPKVLTLGHAYLSSLGFWETARPCLDAVTRATRESCSLAILDGSEVVYVARSAAPHRIMSVGLYVGARLPAHATSMGQVLLAALAPAELSGWLARHDLRAHTRRTLDRPEALRARLAAVREHGYALVDQELEAGLRSIAVPVRDGAGQVIAAMNVSAHSVRVTRTHLVRAFLPHLRCAAARLPAAV